MPVHFAVATTATANMVCGHDREHWPCLAERGLIAVKRADLVELVHVTTTIIKDTDPGLGGSATSRKGTAYGRALVKQIDLDALLVVTERIGSDAFTVKEAAKL